MDFQINCSLFLRLTECDLGNYGLYVVSTRGIRAEQTEADLDDFASKMGGHGEVPLILDFIQEAHLDFPVSATEMLRWQEKNSDFPLPQWLSDVVSAPDAAASARVLANAESNIERTPQFLDAEVKRLKDDGAKAGVWYPIEAEKHRICRQLEAISAVRKLIDEQASLEVPTTHVGGRHFPARQRSDRMASEIETAIEASPVNASAGDIMQLLKRLAGKDGSCITEVYLDGVIWQNLGKDPQKLTLPMLRKRLARRSEILPKDR